MSAQDVQVVDPIELIPLTDYQFSGDNSTVERKCRFIEAFRHEGSIYHAAMVAGIHRTTCYKWIESDPKFALALEESKEDCYDKAETSVFKKALAGDSLLLMFYLKAHRHKFRDKVTIDVESVRDEIQQRMEQLGLSQLPPAMVTASVDSSGNEPQPSPQFPSPPASEQKEQPDHNPHTED